VQTIRMRWLKLPASGRVIGIDLATFALVPEALRDESGVCVSVLGLERADRAAVWAAYAEDRAAFEERLRAHCNGEVSA